MMHTTTPVRGASDTEGNGADDELTTFTPTVNEKMHATAEVRDTTAMPRAMKSKDDEPNTLPPTAAGTMHATAEVRGTRAMPKAKGPKMTNWALLRR